MEPVKKERVSPLIGEAGEGGAAGFDPSAATNRTCITSPTTTPSNHDLKHPPVKTYLPQHQPPPQPQQQQQPSPQPTALPSPAQLATVITTVSSCSSQGGGGGGGAACVREVAGMGVDSEIMINQTNNNNNNNFSGEIGDAVSKILDDYDWSKIPLANKDGAGGSERRKVHVKRPMNAFMVWAQEARRKLSSSHRQVHNAELSKSLGRIWRSMTDAQKSPFVERADHLRRKHKQEYPDYKYQPRRRKENVKTVGKPNTVILQELPTSHQYASPSKGGSYGVGLHPLSPPNSPSEPSGTVRGHPEGTVPDTAFVSDCLVADSLETIDRAEMNKYLLPDQAPPTPYGSTPTHAGLHPMSTMPTTITTMNTITSINTLNSLPTTGSSSHCNASTASLTSLPPMNSRLLPPAPAYGAPGSPYYTGGASPQPPNNGSPELPSELGTSVTATSGDGVSPGGSPGSPSAEFVELQPSRPLKEEPLPSLTMHKTNVSPFLHQNLCYSSQPYAFQYSYPYAPMWH